MLRTDYLAMIMSLARSMTRANQGSASAVSMYVNARRTQTAWTRASVTELKAATSQCFPTDVSLENRFCALVQVDVQPKNAAIARERANQKIDRMDTLAMMALRVPWGIAVSQVPARRVTTFANVCKTLIVTMGTHALA